jgi:hypothetical protein
MRPLLGGTTVACFAAVIAIPSLSSAQGAPDDKKECLAAAERGQTERDDGRYRAARESFLTCARDTCPKVILQSCTRWLRELDQDAPTVVLGAKDAQGSDLTDVKVSFDSAPFATLLDGKPVEADAGEHVFRFEREGSVPVEQKLVLRAGERARVVTVVLRSVGAPTETAEAPTPPEDQNPPPEPLLSTHHVAVGAIGVGALAAAGTGAALLLRSNQDESSAAALRSGLASNACTHAAQSTTCQSLANKVSAQHHEMTVASVMFVGAAGLAAGAVLAWFLWPPVHSSPAPTTGSVAPVPGGAVLQVAGTFR